MKTSSSAAMLALAALLAFTACSSDGGGAESVGAAGTGGAAGSRGEAGAGGEAGTGGELGVGGAGGHAGAGGFGGHGGAGGGVATLRDVLPSIADEAIETANAVPSDERRKAANETLAFLHNTCMPLPPLGVPICLSDLADAESLAEEAGDTAFDEATSAIRPAKAAMLEVKKRALEAPDPSLVEALRASLRDAYRNRTVSVRVTVTRRFDTPFSGPIKIYSGDQTRKLHRPP